LGAKQVLELVIKQTTEGDGVTKVTIDLEKARGGLTDFEKAMSGARSTIGGLDKDIIVFDRNLGSAADAMSAFGISIPTTPMAAFGQLAREGIDLMWESIQMAGDANEQYSLFQQTFREESEVTRAELEAFGDDVGRSTTELMSMASGIQTILAPMGMARDVSADWSVKLAQLATDLGAAFNREDADVLADIRSGLMGSTEVMEKYGVNLKMSAINQELLNMGIEGGVQNADELQKMQARLNLVMAQTSDYQGQAARESEGFNGQLKELTANTNDLQIALGKIALPAIMPYLRDITDAAGATANLVEKMAALNGEGEGAWEMFYDLNQVLNPVYMMLGLIGDVGNDLGEKTLPQILSEFARGNTILRPFAYNIELIVAGYKDLSDWIRTGEMGDHVEEVKAAYAATEKLKTVVGEFTEGELADMSVGLMGVTVDMGDYEEQTIAATTAQDEFEASMSDLRDLMNGSMGPAFERFTDKQADLADQIAEVEDQIADLEAKSYLTSAQKGQLEDLQGKLGDLKGESAELTAQFEEDSKRRQFAILEEQAVAAGVYDAEFFDNLARNWGLVDEATEDYTTASAEFWERVHDDAAIALSDILALGLTIDNLPEEWRGKIIYDVSITGALLPNTNFTISTGGGSTVNTGIRGVVRSTEQEGGIVVPGQTVWVGELGPEPVVFDQPARVVSNRDAQNGAVGGGGLTLQFFGPTYFRTEEELRTWLENVLVEAARG